MPLTRISDMVVMENCDEHAMPDGLTNRESLEAGEMRKRVSYWERLKQRGTPATISIVEALINEIGMPSDVAICLVEYFPSPASEYLKAVRDINLAKLTGNYDGPIAARIFSVCFAPDIDCQRFMKNQIQNDVFHQYFEGRQALPLIGKLGSKSLPEQDLPPHVPPPALKLGYVIRTGKKPNTRVPRTCPHAISY